jgi:DNA-binding winged helix-turn-helix (wHTH) protein
VRPQCIVRRVKARFGDFLLDTGRRQVTGSGPIHLSPKAFDLLVLLIQHRSRVLSKAELHDRLWPDTFVVETNLATLIAEIRDALNDPARQPRFVRTAHRFGYGFCGDVVEIDEAPAPGVSLCWLLRDGRRLLLSAGENIVGRDPTASIQIDSPSVSRRHTRIVVSDSGVTVEDLSSKNGTYVRGTAVSSSVRLNDGDELRIGSVVLHFRQQVGPGSTVTV